ncbi:hypothetical protein ABZX85_42525 [Streptomyces sp. NPDC004539]|uniref:hypothetical protein n=1 Tax=Streptomyces sp. NPDC004539 TaxID=3154280 RepID=UPI00339F83A8
MGRQRGVQVVVEGGRQRFSCGASEEAAVRVSAVGMASSLICWSVVPLAQNMPSARGI